MCSVISLLHFDSGIHEDLRPCIRHLQVQKFPRYVYENKTFKNDDLNKRSTKKLKRYDSLDTGMVGGGDTHNRTLGTHHRSHLLPHLGRNYAIAGPTRKHLGKKTRQWYQPFRCFVVFHSRNHQFECCPQQGFTNDDFETPHLIT